MCTWTSRTSTLVVSQRLQRKGRGISCNTHTLRQCVRHTAFPNHSPSSLRHWHSRAPNFDCGQHPLHTDRKVDTTPNPGADTWNSLRSASSSAKSSSAWYCGSIPKTILRCSLQSPTRRLSSQPRYAPAAGRLSSPASSGRCNARA